MQQLQDHVTQLESRVDASLLDQRESIGLRKENEDLRRLMTEKNKELSTEVTKLSAIVESNANQYSRELTVLKESQDSTLKQRDDVISGLRRDLESNRRECAELE